jgi:hypothetical protein
MPICESVSVYRGGKVAEAFGFRGGEAGVGEETETGEADVEEGEYVVGFCGRGGAG